MLNIKTHMLCILSRIPDVIIKNYEFILISSEIKSNKLRFHFSFSGIM